MKAINNEQGIQIENSVGTIDSSEISGNQRVYTSQGGGLIVLNSDIRTRGLVINKNKAETGAAIYCNGGSLNLFQGSIEGNTATSGTALYCSQSCSMMELESLEMTKLHHLIIEEFQQLNQSKNSIWIL